MDNKMQKRFEGADGERHLISVLKNCSIVEHDEALAKRLREFGKVVSFEQGTSIILQGGADNDIYFLLAGQAKVLINGRQVAVRVAGDSIGEMALLNPSEPRSATLVAENEVVTLKIDEVDFQRIANEFPNIWKTVALVVAERLRQRGAFLNLPNDKPLLFLGCSNESLEIVREIQLGLKNDNIEVFVWIDGSFGPGGVAIDSLIKIINEVDFAAFVFSPDDKAISRSVEYNAPRDNIIFELGLFMGKLDRNRTFIIKEQKTDVKIPTDLLGVTHLTYVYPQGANLTAAIATTCTELRKVIKNLGVR